MSSYLVKVSGCPVGTVTTRGTVTNVEREGIDYYVLTFDSGEVKRFRYNQALAVIES